jgi:hypothetical protein
MDTILFRRLENIDLHPSPSAARPQPPADQRPNRAPAPAAGPQRQSFRAASAMSFGPIPKCSYNSRAL